MVQSFGRTTPSLVNFLPGWARGYPPEDAPVLLGHARVDRPARQPYGAERTRVKDFGVLGLGIE